MSALEDKEKDLNKLKAKIDILLKNNHPASDKIEVWTDPFILCICLESCIYPCATKRLVLL